MASLEAGAPTHATTQSSVKWSSKLTSYVSGRGSFAVENQRKVDVALRAFMFICSLVSVVVVATSKQSTIIPVSPTMTVNVDAKFTHLSSFTYFLSAFSFIGLYSMITGYASYSALKRQELSSTSQQLHFLLLDILILAIAASATGAAGGVAYEALKGNPHIRWMKMCNMFDTFCDHIAAAGCVALVNSIAIILLIWLSIGAIVKNSGR